MNRSPVGKWGISFRTDKDMLLQEMAQRLSTSSSYLSSIEHGRKPLPEDWHQRVEKALMLDLPSSASLKIAIMRTNREARIPVETDYQARILVAFERNRVNIDEDTAEKIEAVLSSPTGTGKSINDPLKSD